MKIDPANGADTDSERPDAVEADGGAEAEAQLAGESGAEPEARVVDEGEAEATVTDDVDSDGVEAETADDAVDAEAASDDDSDDSAVVDAPSAEPLTITLPDGSESVSEAILSNRRMLTTPEEHGLASESELEEVRDALDTLSTEVSDDLRAEVSTLETSLDGVEERLDRQGRQIGELRDTVASLAEILGASVEFQETE